MGDSNDKFFRVFVLGAGFSAAAGLPLAPELWAEICRRARTIPGAEHFERDLERYLEFRRLCDGDRNVSEDNVNFEHFMSFLDIEHFLVLKGHDRWSEDGSRSTMVVKWLLGQILTERTPSPDDIPDCYLDFARNLQPDDYVLTFNYDILLERAMEKVRKPYRLFPYRSKRKEVILLKLHGSVDWFDKTQRLALEQEHGHQSVASFPHPVFNNAVELDVFSIDDGLRDNDDPLGQMYRVGNVDLLYEEMAATRYGRDVHFMGAPWLLTPSTMKILYAEKLREFWYGMNNLGFYNGGMVIVGYSLPSQDEYARQAVYTIVRNYQENYGWNEDLFDRRKSPLVLVDLCQDEESLRRLEDSFKFVNWDRAQLIRSGFGSEAVASMFGTQ